MNAFLARRIFRASPPSTRLATGTAVVGRSLACHGRLYAQMPPRRKIEDSEIEEKFLKGSGPGGQKINKTNSAVQLMHLPTGVVVKSQATRSRTRNREIARRLLSEKLEVMELGDQSRVALKAAAKRKKRASADRKKRRKYRKLEEGKEAASAEDGLESEEVTDAGQSPEGQDK